MSAVLDQSLPVRLPPSLNFINGEWQDDSSAPRIDVINPADEQVIGQIPNSGQAALDEAVAAANAAFRNPEWAAMPPLGRERLLHKLASLLEENMEEMATIESLDNGKPYGISSTFDVPLSAEWIRYYAGWPSKLSGESLDLALQPLGSHHAYTVREPVGVVGAIVPWNYPLVLAIWKMAPALAAGCTMVLKPAEQTPFSALRLAELIEEAGFPKGVFNVVLGDGKLGQRMVDHPNIQKISFTGSTRVGKLIVQSVANDLKRVTLELGGKSPTIIMPDADMDITIPGATQAVFMNSGQLCFAGTRLYAPRKQFDQVLEGIAEVAATMPIGPGLDPETLLGPVVSQVQVDSIMSKIDESKNQGAAVFTGGNRMDREGYFIDPTILITEDRNNTAYRDEFFGPVLTATPYDDLDDLADMANDSDYGLGANIYTENVSNAHMLASKIKAGTVWVNTQLSPDPNMPFGGFKQSGWGRENGADVFASYTETKSIIMKLSRD